MVEGGIHTNPDPGRFKKPGEVSFGKGIISNALFGKGQRKAEGEKKTADEQIEARDVAKKTAEKKKAKANDRRAATKRKNAADETRRARDLKHYEDKRELKRKHDEMDRQARGTAKPARTSKPAVAKPAVAKPAASKPARPAAGKPASPAAGKPAPRPMDRFNSNR